MKEKRKGSYVRKWSTQSIKQFIIDNNIQVELLSEYIDMYTKMAFRCSCGNIFYTNWHEFNNKKFPKRQCNECGRKKPNDENKITCDYIKKYLIDNNYTCELLSTEYIGCDNKLMFKCECGNIFYASWSNIKSMSGFCKQCAMQQVTHEEFINKISVHLDMFEILEEYKNSTSKIKIRCKRCGSIIYQTPKNIIERGICCHCCSGSKGEQYVGSYLINNNIVFYQQYIFDDCKNINHLPFDFYLPDYNVCIEYQGAQHYFAVDYFGGKDAYESQIKRDLIKKEFCKNNSIRLIEISYKDFNKINYILDNALLSNKEVVSW